MSDAIISHNAEYTDVVRKITRSMPLRALSLQMKVLSGDLGALETQPAETLRKDHGLDSPALLNRLGYDLLQHRRPAEAINVFKANARLFPDDPNAYDSLGEALERDNRKEEALASYEKAVLKARERNDPRLGIYEKNFNRLKGAEK
ncbi:MAG: tetratricopeptide repeat protein [Acidobacteria bacterium]|nr:tetratricopeptide repeat protein [Acidobacteriota bacterium]